jgi:hypothetical protein
MLNGTQKKKRQPYNTTPVSLNISAPYQVPAICLKKTGNTSPAFESRNWDNHHKK